MVDTDSSVELNTIWEMVQFFVDSRGGAIGVAIRVRNTPRRRDGVPSVRVPYAIFPGGQVFSDDHDAPRSVLPMQ